MMIKTKQERDKNTYKLSLNDHIKFICLRLFKLANHILYSHIVSYDIDVILRNQEQFERVCCGTRLK